TAKESGPTTPPAFHPAGLAGAPASDEPSTAHASFAPDRFTPLASALRESETLAGRAYLFHLISDLSAEELPALIERAMRLPLKYRKELVAALFERWVAIDPANAESWIRLQGN